MLRKTFSVALLAGLTLPLAAPAAVLVKINERGSRAIFSGPELEFSQIGDRLRIGNDCEVIIDRKLYEGDNRVGVRTSSCQNRMMLTRGASAALISVVNDNTELEDTADIQMSTASYRRSMVSQRSLPREKMMNGLGIGLLMTNATKSGEAKESLTSPFVLNKFERTLEEGSSSSAGVGVNLNYSMVPRQGLGFTTDLMISQFQKVISDDAYLYTRPAVNVAYGFLDRFYVAGGANYMVFLQEPEYMEGSFQGQKIGIKPEIGLQVGAGMVLKDQWQGQIQYAQSKQKINTSLNTDRTEGTYSSGEVAGNYDFSSLELTLQYRF